MKHVVYIDRLKGFTILIVVIAHVYLVSLNMGDSLVFKLCSSFEMPLFMFLSGYVAFLNPLHTDSKIIKQKLLKRFFRYFCPGFFIIPILYGFVSIITGNQSNLINNGIIEGYWYLKSLATFVILQIVLVSCPKEWQKIIILIIAELFFLFIWKTNTLFAHLFCMEHNFFYLPYFVFGYYFRKYNLENLFNKNWIYTISLATFLTFSYINFDIQIINSISGKIIKPISAIITVTYLFKNRDEKNSKLESWLCYIGSNTLDIYLYHGLLIYGPLQCVGPFTIKNGNSEELYSFMYFILAIGISILLSYISIIIGYVLKTSNIIRRTLYGEFNFKQK